MTVFVPMTGLTLVLQNTPPDSTEVIGFYPSIISDSTAAADQLLSQDSAASVHVPDGNREVIVVSPAQMPFFKQEQKSVFPSGSESNLESI